MRKFDRLKIAIIKTGRSETFAQSDLSEPSLGDVLRSTVLLHLYKRDHVTWITSRAAAPLLMNNPYIARIVMDEDGSEETLKGFDIIVNLERDSSWIRRVAQTTAGEKHGFLEVGEPPRNLGRLNWQQGLYAMVNQNWKNQEYLYNALPVTQTRFDFGLNWAVGTKWPNKAWKQAHWELLASILSRYGTVSWQRGFDSISDYANWISSCRTIITPDSLGLHLALALKRMIVALFGPTPSEQVHLYDRGVALGPNFLAFSCAPCLKPVCSLQVSCMEVLPVERVVLAAISFLKSQG